MWIGLQVKNIPLPSPTVPSKATPRAGNKNKMKSKSKVKKARLENSTNEQNPSFFFPWKEEIRRKEGPH